MSTMYYPDMSAPSACINKYLQNLKYYYDIDIITKTEKTNYTPSSTWKIHYISSKLHELRKRINNNINEGRHKTISKLAKLGINLLKLLQTQFLFPTAQHWEVNAYHKALEEIHKEHPIDVVIPVSNNFVTQLATLKFHKRHPDVKWIAFITDPYAESYIYYKYKILKGIWKKLNLKKEQEIYDKCTYAMFTPEMYKFIPTTFTVNPDKIYKIEFALDNKTNTISERVEWKRQSDKCKLIFAGQFYKKIRNPEFMLSIISKSEHIELDLYVGYGECDDILANYSVGNITRSDFVDYDTYLDFINNKYDILIIVGNNTTLQAPSKTVELLSTGKPIVNFYHTKDTQYNMIEKYPLGINIGQTDPKPVEKLELFCNEMKGRKISFEEVVRIFPENALPYQIDLLKQLIEN